MKQRGAVKESFELAANLCFGDVLGPLKELGLWLYGNQAIDVTRRYNEIFEMVTGKHERERGRERGREREEKDLMGVLSDVHHNDEAEFKITGTHIKADMFIAGTDTSAEATQWAMAVLINHPDVFNKVREEIESVVGRTTLVEESYQTFLIYKQKKHRDYILPLRSLLENAVDIAKWEALMYLQKTAVAINLYAIMKDPDVWNDPNEFHPERFLISSSEQQSQLWFSVLNGKSGDKGKVDVEFGPGMSLRMAKPL
ncbi:LOW QUALITY PROTEIN: Cytochrome P450, partial [Dillenia turbinata]